MGPETQAAIKAAEMVLGRKPTGTITVKDIEAIKNKGAAADNNSLANALGAIEAVLAKYKIKTESIEEQIDAYILKNINEYSQQEQLEIWRTLTETEIYVPPNSGGRARDAGTQARMQMAQNPNPALSRANDPFGLIGRSETSPAPKQSKLAKFAGKLGGAKGIGKKLVGRAAATAIAGPAALAVGAGLTAWTAYDIGKALYDTFASTEIADLDPADQKIITDNLKTVMAYEQDPKMLATLPNELQLRVSNVAKGLNSLAVDVGAVTPPSTTPAEKSTAPATTAPPTVTTKNELKIAGEPVVPGQPLSQKQMSVMQLSINSGNTYPPEVMDQYNKQKASPTTTPQDTGTNKTPISTGKWKTSSVQGSDIDSPRRQVYSLSSNNTEDLGFPYGKTQLTLHIRVENGKLDTNGGIFVTSAGQFYDSEDRALLMKFDNEPTVKYGYSKSRSGSGGIAFIYSDNRYDLAKKIESSQKLKIQISYFQRGNETFEFDTAGLKLNLQDPKKTSTTPPAS